MIDKGKFLTEENDKVQQESISRQKRHYTWRRGDEEQEVNEDVGKKVNADEETRGRRG